MILNASTNQALQDNIAVKVNIHHRFNILMFLFFNNFDFLVLCQTNICQNGGTCISNKDDSKTCVCMDGYTGDLCDIVTCNTELVLFNIKKSIIFNA